MKSIAPFLMFTGAQHGKAEEAMQLYIGLLGGSVEHIERYGAGDAGGQEGTVKVARFKLNGQDFMAIDSMHPHGFSFTPALSLFIECDSPDEQERAYQTLLDGGKVLMPLDNYGFRRRLGWVEDKYGVSWQLNLA